VFCVESPLPCGVRPHLVPEILAFVMNRVTGRIRFNGRATNLVHPRANCCTIRRPGLVVSLPFCLAVSLAAGIAFAQSVNGVISGVVLA
jgi:hypothetical protein